MQQSHGKKGFRNSVSAKTLSVLCSAVMAFGMTPASAFADPAATTDSTTAQAAATQDASAGTQYVDFIGVDNATTLDDGEYTPGAFAFTGGPDGVSLTCTKVVVVGGKAYATFQARDASGQPNTAVTHAYLATGTTTGEDATLYDPATGKSAAGVYAFAGDGTVTVPVDLNVEMPLSLRTVSGSAGSWTTTGTYQITLAEKSVQADLKYTVKGDHAVVSGINNAAQAEEIVIPSTYQGLPVTEIGFGAFLNAAQVTKVTIPDSVTTIGKGAFQNCTSLTSLTLPSGVTSVEDSLFQGCTALASVSLPSGLTSINYSAFFGCTALQTITIPNGVTTIGTSAFQGCEALASANIPGSVTSLGTSVFNGCISLTSLTLGSGLTTIGGLDFMGCSALTSVEIPSTVTSIGMSAFNRCTSLTSLVVPEGVTTLGNYAFANCTGLTSVSLPASLTAIGTSAFQKVTATITVPAGSAAEEYCKKDSTLTYEVIGEEPVKECPVTCTVADGKATVTGLVDASATSVEIPATYTQDGVDYPVTAIGDRAFSRCSNLQSIVISEGVESLGDSAIYANDKLTSVTLPSTLKTIGRRALANNSKLAGPLVIPEGVTSIGEQAFMWDSSIAEVTLPVSVTSIEPNSFQGLSSSANTTFTVTAGSYAEQWCHDNNVKKYEVISPVTCTVTDGKATVTGLADTAATDTNLVIPATYTQDGTSYPITAIGERSFVGTKLQSIVIPEGVESIEASAIYNNGSLTSVMLPSTLKTIGKRAFALNSKLAGPLVIPEGVTSIGEQAFMYDSAITEITIPASVTSIGRNAFQKVNATFKVPAGSYAAEWCEENKVTYETFDPGALAIGTTSLPDGEVGMDYSAKVDASDTSATFAAEGLPAGLTMASDGTISGVPTAAGDASVTVTATAGDKTATATLTIKVAAAQPAPVTFSISDGKATVTGLADKTATSIVIPSSYVFEGVAYPVTAIGASAFEGCTSLESVKLPSSLTSIGSRAFTGSSIKEIAIPAGVTEIPETCFWKCSKLETVNLPAGLTSIGDYAFQECGALTGVTMPDSLKTIGKQAFYRCYSFGSFVLPDGVTSIGNYAFYDDYVIENATIPASVTSIGYRAFSSSSARLNLTVDYGSAAETYAIDNSIKYTVRPESIVKADPTYQVANGAATVTGMSNGDAANMAEIPATCTIDGTEYPVTAVASGAFSNSKILSVTIPDSVTSIGESAFAGTQLREVSIPGSVTTIARNSFSSNDRLTSVTLGDGVTTIADGAFSDDSKLSSVTIPASVTSIADGAFANCPSLVITGTPGTAAETYATAHNAKFHDASEVYADFTFSVDSEGNATVTGTTNGSTATVIDIPSTYNGHPVTTINSLLGATGAPKYAKTIIIPDSVTSISTFGLASLSAVESITIPSSVTDMGVAVFTGDASLKELTLPAGCVKNIGNNMFSDCTSLTELVLPEGTESITSGSFRRTSNLRMITIPDSVTTIDDGVFNDCHNLTIVANHGTVAAEYAASHNIPISYPDETPATRVADTIAQLPDADAVTAADKDAIEAARAAYDALSDELKEKVGSIDRLTAAEAALAQYLSDVVVTTESLPDAIVGQEYTTQLAFSGPKTATWALTEGTLPAGLTLDEATGTISGTPTAPVASTFTVVATGPNGQEGTKQLTITAKSADQAAADAVAAQIAALPPSVLVNTSGATAEEAAAVQAAKAAYDALTPAQQELVSNRARLDAAVSHVTLGFSSATLRTMTAGQRLGGGATIPVTGAGNLTVEVAAGALPEGVSIEKNLLGRWTLAGTPAFGTGGTYDVTLRLSTDIAGIAPVEQEFQLTVEAGASRVERLAGSAESGAAGTAAAIAAEAFAGQSPDYVVIARNDDYHDALAGAGLAGALGAPILLTDKDGLSQAAADEIEDLGAIRAVVLGGESAVSPQVVSDLKDLNLSVDRLGGADVYGTSMAINERLVEMEGANARNAVVVNPTTFADALSISGWAYANRVPVMLQTWGDTAAERGFDDKAKAILQGRHLIVCGGEGAVSTESVEGLDPEFERLGGDTIYDTSLEIADWELHHGMSARDVTVASAIPDYGGVDALAGSALAGRAGGVTLLAQSNGGFGWYDGGESAIGFVRAHASEVQKVHVLGGAVASTPALYDAIREALGEDPAAE